MWGYVGDKRVKMNASEMVGYAVATLNAVVAILGAIITLKQMKNRRGRDGRDDDLG